MKTLKLIALATLLGSSLATVAAPLEPAQAQQALARGAVALDLRVQADTLLPGAVRLPELALQRWLEQGDVAALAAAVSDAGLNLAGEVLVYGADADPRVAAIAQRLATLSRGRIHHLLGGIEAWHGAGLPTQAQPARRLPLPQRLAAEASNASATERPAGAAWRQTADHIVAPADLTALRTSQR